MNFSYQAPHSNAKTSHPPSASRTHQIAGRITGFAASCWQHYRTVSSIRTRNSGWLIGPISGTWEGGVTVGGQTAQLYFHSKTQYNGGPISLASGTTAIATPEPGTLGLTGMGLVGLGMTIRRKLQRFQSLQEALAASLGGATKSPVRELANR